MKGSLVLVIAIVVGILAAVLVRQQISGERRNIEAQWGAVEICIAADTLKAGDSIDVEYGLQSAPLPKGFAAMNDYVLWTDRASLQGQFVNTVIQKGKIVDRRFLGKRESAETAVIEPNRDYRLVAVKVNEVTGTAGHLRPGDRVDVLHTSGELVTELILEDVQVKHTGRPQTSRSGGQNTSYTTVTLEVGLREAMVLANAGSTGAITLIKRRGPGSPASEQQARPVKPGDYRSQVR